MSVCIILVVCLLINSAVVSTCDGGLLQRHVDVFFSAVKRRVAILLRVVEKNTW